MPPVSEAPARRALSVVIPARDSAGTLGACLEAVFDSEYRDFEVVVVDDCSRDGTQGVVAGFPCRMVSGGAPRGPAAARNAGAREACGRVLMFIDSDIVVSRGALGRVAELLTSGVCDAVVGMLDKDSAYGNLASFYKNAYMHYTYRILPPEMGVFYSSIAAITRDAFRGAGGFDEEYRDACIEDTEFGGRIRARGYRMLLDKELVVRHLRHYRIRELLETGFRRTSGIVKIALRKLAGRSGSPMHLTSPRSFTAGIALSMLACAAALLSPVAGKALLPAALVLVLTSLLLNAGFLTFVAREGGLARGGFAIPLLIADQIAHGLGAIHGVISYARGERY
ncbi:MAG: glycosyltransferase [Chlamydiota bacterium]